MAGFVGMLSETDYAEELGTNLAIEEDIGGGVRGTRRVWVAIVYR